MGLFNIFKKKTPPREPLEVGVTEPVCPYCNGALEKMPARKKQCPHCGKYMFVRTRPQDRVKILVTDKQTEIIEEQWSIINGTHDEYLAKKQEFEDEKQRIVEQFGHVPTDNDVKWGLLNKEAIDHAVKKNWGLYRNTRCEMAELLRKELKYKHALSMYCWVCYLDLNGPRNTNSINDEEILREFPPFSPKEAFLAPGIISRITKLVNKLNIDEAEVAKTFLETAEHDFQGLKLPIPPQDAWQSLRGSLYNQ